VTHFESFANLIAITKNESKVHNLLLSATNHREQQDANS
jgi:hypothetical protein